MKILHPSTNIYSDKSKIAGIGVFASENISSGEIIEEAPILGIPEDQIDDLAKTELLNYFFGSGGNFEVSAIILGYGSLYNHSYTPNAKFEKVLGEKFLTFVAIKEIKKGEEILINYNGDPDNMSKLWFMD